jgi:hypothetical protein
VNCAGAQWNENQFSEQKNGRVRKKSTFKFYKKTIIFGLENSNASCDEKKNKKKLMLLWLAATQNE